MPSDTRGPERVRTDRRPALLNYVVARLRRFGVLVREYYLAPHRASIARARRDEDDVFMLIVFSEMMGMPNPVSYYTLELQPVLYDRFHEWHLRMGMERSPLEGFRCC